MKKQSLASANASASIFENDIFLDSDNTANNIAVDKIRSKKVSKGGEGNTSHLGRSLDPKENPAARRPTAEFEPLSQQEERTYAS